MDAQPVHRVVLQRGRGYFEELPGADQRLGVEDGLPVVLSGRRGRVAAVARVTTATRPDTVFMPFHWPGVGSVNRITNDATDPISGMPEFKVCAVTVARADLPTTTEVPA